MDEDPAVHTEHADAPLLLVYVPFVQGMHNDELLSLENVPAGHAMHELDALESEK